MPPLFFGGDSYFFLYLQFLFFFSFAAFLALRTLQWAVRRRRRVERAPLVIGVFHPFADAGGGGERVLWRALAELIAMKRTAVAASDAMARARLLLYTGDAAAPAELLARAQARFGIDIGPDDVQCVRLHWRYWSTAEAWPRFTLLLQSVGGALVAAEAMWRAPADLYVDTLGYAFAYPVWTYVGGARVLCYTHYPVISADMLASVRERRADTVHNRSAAIARSPLLTQAKLLYYEAFALLYGACARRAHLALANSAWTAEHLARVWRTPRCTHAATHALHARPRSLLCVRIVYPPCDTRRLCQLPLESAARAGSQQLLSIAQFRPEKNHALQIRSLAHFLAAQPHRRAHCRLVLAGGCRHAGDEQRVRELRALALALGVEHNVAFEINCTFDRLLQLLAESLIGQ